MIALIAPTPLTNGEIDRLTRYIATLGLLPDGVVQPARNVWLVDAERAIDFVRLAGQIAGQVGLEIRAYSTVPTQRAESQPMRDRQAPQ